MFVAIGITVGAGGSLGLGRLLGTSELCCDGVTPEAAVNPMIAFRPD